MSVKSRRQALKLCLDAVVVVEIGMFHELLLEVIHRLELLQIQKFTFKQAKEVFYYSIVRAVIFSGSCSAVCLSYEASAGTVCVGIATLGRNEESDWSHCLYDLLLKIPAYTFCLALLLA